MRFVLLVAFDIRISAVAPGAQRFDVAFVFFREGGHGRILGPAFLRFAVAFAPFEKGGHGGFALDPALLEQNQEPIPRHRFAMPAPFCKGGYDSKAAPASVAVAPFEKAGHGGILGPASLRFAAAFAPFEKGDHGRFALDSALLEQNQEPIPRHRFAMPAHFCKGGHKSKAGPASSVRRPCPAAQPGESAERSHSR
jgi:hypothetical protein